VPFAATAARESDHLVAQLDIGAAGVPNPQRSRSECGNHCLFGRNQQRAPIRVYAEFARCVPGTGNRAGRPQREGTDADLSLLRLLLPRAGERDRA
jgi:hypothetical protein